MKKWEYAIITDSDQLDEYGDLGWELVSVTERMGYYRYFLKKEILE